MRWWKSLCKGLGDNRFGLWPLQQSSVKDVDACNFKLMSMMVGVRPRSGESAEAFCRRKKRIVKHEVLEADVRLSDHWVFKVVAWLEHLLRHPACPATRLLLQQTPEWLETCRSFVGKSTQYSTDRAGITLTRAGRGQPVRYLGEWWRDISFHNPSQSAIVSRQTAMQLYNILSVKT